MPRKKPFSTKQKKKQLQEKRHRKQGGQEEDGHVQHRPSEGENSDDSEHQDEQNLVRKVNQQPMKKTDKKYDPNRYRLHFERDTKEDIAKGKELSRQPYVSLPEQCLEIGFEEVFRPGTVLDMPKRPPWDYSLSKKQLERREEAYFREYLENIFEKHGHEELSYFELNLETWRQLWRVLEMADIVLLIIDIRYPVLHFSPALYDYVTKELKKRLVLVLNKVDLAPPPLVVAWKHYLQGKFPEIKIVLFTSFPKNREERESEEKDPGKVLHKKRKKTGQYNAVGQRELLHACEHITKEEVDLTSWKELIDSRDNQETEAICEDEADISHSVDEIDTSFSEHEHYKDGILTIGCVGFPNVGKSSLLNGLVGRKVVSVSRTPGHTKHFQTIFLTPTVKLCDCPGLVFPSLVPKQLQILAGIYPVSQVREPYSPIHYLAERIPLPQILRVKNPNSDADKPGTDSQWSAWDICEAWAEKRGFLTAKAARNDVYRAANHLLRLAVEGRLCMCMRPPGFSVQKLDWERHPDSGHISDLQILHRQNREDDLDEQEGFSSSEEEGEKDIDSQERNSGDEEEDKDGHLTTKNPFALLGDD